MSRRRYRSIDRERSYYIRDLSQSLIIGQSTFPKGEGRNAFSSTIRTFQDDATKESFLEWKSDFTSSVFFPCGLLNASRVSHRSIWFLTSYSFNFHRISPATSDGRYSLRSLHFRIAIEIFIAYFFISSSILSILFDNYSNINDPKILCYDDKKIRELRENVTILREKLGTRRIRVYSKRDLRVWK